MTSSELVRLRRRVGDNEVKKLESSDRFVTGVESDDMEMGRKYGSFWGVESAGDM